MVFNDGIQFHSYTDETYSCLINIVLQNVYCDRFIAGSTQPSLLITKQKWLCWLLLLLIKK